MATVQSQQGTQAQKKAVYDYAQIDVERQRKLFEAAACIPRGFRSGHPGLQNPRDYESNTALSDPRDSSSPTRHPRSFNGIVGISPSTLATTSLPPPCYHRDENADLEATSTSHPAGIAGSARPAGRDSRFLGQSLVKSTYSFSPAGRQRLPEHPRQGGDSSDSPDSWHQQLVKRRVTWSTAPAPVVPVLAVSLVGDRPSSTWRLPKATDTCPSGARYGRRNRRQHLSRSRGLKPGDKVITSGLQFLQEGAPVKPLG